MKISTLEKNNRARFKKESPWDMRNGQTDIKAPGNARFAAAKEIHRHDDNTVKGSIKRGGL